MYYTCITELLIQREGLEYMICIRTTQAGQAPPVSRALSPPPTRPPFLQVPTSIWAWEECVRRGALQRTPQFPDTSPQAGHLQVRNLITWFLNCLLVFDLPTSIFMEGFPGGASGQEPFCQLRRGGFDPWVGKIHWRRVWQPNPVFLPEEGHGQRSLEGYSPWGHKESEMTEGT